MEFMVLSAKQERTVNYNDFALVITEGTAFRYGERKLEVVLVDKNEAMCRTSRGTQSRCLSMGTSSA